MIKLHIDDYCNNCSEFDADVNTISMYNFNGTLINETTVKCIHRDCCKRIKRYLEEQEKP